MNYECELVMYACGTIYPDITAVREIIKGLNSSLVSTTKQTDFPTLLLH